MESVYLDALKQTEAAAYLGRLNLLASDADQGLAVLAKNRVSATAMKTRRSR